MTYIGGPRFAASVFAASQLGIDSAGDFPTGLSVDEAEGDCCEDGGGEKNLHP